MGNVKIDESLNVTRTMYTWVYAYRQSRKSNWEEAYLDSLRFKNRVKRAGIMLNPYLNIEFRSKIYNERFKNVTPNTT